jgi:hypothetical protein
MTDSNPLRKRTSPLCLLSNTQNWFFSLKKIPFFSQQLQVYQKRRLYRTVSETLTDFFA